MININSMQCFVLACACVILCFELHAQAGTILHGQHVHATLVAGVSHCLCALLSRCAHPHGLFEQSHELERCVDLCAIDSAVELYSC